jgi:uncharacterized protein (TIGR00106 family)
MAIVEVSIVPIGTGDTSVSQFVADALTVLQRAGLSYRLTPMGTIIEGDLREVMDIVLRMHETPFVQGIGRVYTTIKIDDRRDRQVTMEDKVKAVADRLRREE